MDTYCSHSFASGFFCSTSCFWESPCSLCQVLRGWAEYCSMVWIYHNLFNLLMATWIIYSFWLVNKIWYKLTCTVYGCLHFFLFGWSLLYTVILYTGVWIYHSLFSQFPINGLWVSFQSFAITDNVSITFICMCTDTYICRINTYVGLQVSRVKA